MSAHAPDRRKVAAYRPPATIPATRSEVSPTTMRYSSHRTTSDAANETSRSAVKPMPVTSATAADTQK